jgi:hypothetical protein
MKTQSFTLSSGTNPQVQIEGRVRIYKIVLVSTAAFSVRGVDSPNTTLTQDIPAYDKRTFGAPLTRTVDREPDMFDCPHPSLRYEIPGSADVIEEEAEQTGVAKTELFVVANPGAATTEIPLNVVAKMGLTTNILTGTAGTLTVYYDRLY